MTLGARLGSLLKNVLGGRQCKSTWDPAQGMVENLLGHAPVRCGKGWSHWGLHRLFIDEGSAFQMELRWDDTGVASLLVLFGKEHGHVHRKLMSERI